MIILPISRSEREVIEMRISGYSFRTIASIRGCALSTVANLSHTACKKLGVCSTRDRKKLKAVLRRHDCHSSLHPFQVSLDPADY